MQASVTETVGNIVQDPLSAILVGIGALLILFSMGVFGYLSLGAVVDVITPN